MKKSYYDNQVFEVDEKTLDIWYNGKKLSKFLFHKLDRIYICYNADGLNKIAPEYRIICQAFHPDPDYAAKQVDHIDNNHLNDRPENLRWVSRKFNNTRKHALRLRSENARCSSHVDEVIKGTGRDGEIKYFNNGKDAAKQIGCTSVLVYNVLNKMHWAKRAKGWKLEWVKIADLPPGTVNKTSRSKFRNAKFKIEFTDGRPPVETDYEGALRVTGLTASALKARASRYYFIKGIKVTII